MNYINYLLVAIPTITGFASISAFVSLVRTPIGFLSFTIELKVWAITARIKKYKSIIKKKKKHDKIVLLANYKLSSIEVLVS